MYRNEINYKEWLEKKRYKEALNKCPEYSIEWGEVSSREIIAKEANMDEWTMSSSIPTFDEEKKITPKDCLNVIIEGSENVFRDIGCSNPEEKLRKAEKKDKFVSEKKFPYTQLKNIKMFYRVDENCGIGLVPPEFNEIFRLICQFGKRINLPITFSADFSFIPYKDELEISNFLLEKKE